MSCCRGQKEDLRSPSARAIAQHGFWELSPGPLEEEQTLLTPKSSLWPPFNYVFILLMCTYICAYGCTCHGELTEIRGQCVGILPAHRSQGWNLVPRLGFKCLQLPTEPSHWPIMWKLQEVLWVCNRPAQPVLCAQTTVVGPLANASIFPTEVTR